MSCKKDRSDVNENYLLQLAFYVALDYVPKMQSV
jgi:hypothetical protein